MGNSIYTVTSKAIYTQGQVNKMIVINIEVLEIIRA